MIGRPAMLLTPAAVALGFSLSALAQETRPAPPPASPIERRVEAFVTQLEAKRKEFGVVGAAVVVAHRDRIVKVVGLGQRKADSPEPVTGDTVFPMASVTKQFTAIAVALAVSEGKMAFEDHPRRFVPEFRLKDPEADSKLNLIDLLAHRSGLDRSDFTFLYGAFTQDELLRLAGRATPAAKFREKFLYNNTMFSLAGAALGRAYGTTYERFMRERVLAPLGMRASTLTLEGLAASPDRATGYLNGGVLATQVNLAAIAPAGALNSTARDMGAWLLFLNARGQSAGPRIAPAAYARVLENHHRPGAGQSYGLGFYFETRSGILIAGHPGNVPGYSAQVVHVPARSLSFALMTNQNESLLGAAAQQLFWTLVVLPELPAAAPPPQAAQTPPTTSEPIPAERLLGEYFATKIGLLEIKKTDTGLAVTVAGSPLLPLKQVGVNRYDAPGFGGAIMSIADSDTLPGRLTAWLLSPPGQPPENIGFLKKDGAWLARAKAQPGRANAALIGAYRSLDRKIAMEIAPYRDGIALIDTTQPPRLLIEAGRDRFRLEGLPESHRLQVRRTRSDTVIGFVLAEPNASQEMLAELSASAGDPAQARAILERAVAAAGGAAALDRLVSKSAVGRAIAAPHGVDGPASEYVVLGKRATLSELGAFGKTIISMRAVNGERGGYWIGFGGARVAVTGKALAAARFAAVPHTLYRWKERFAAAAVVGETVANGEHVYVIELTPRDLAPTRFYISAETHMILREEAPVYFGDALLTIASSIDYSDFRPVNGIRVPFALVTTMPMLGRVATAYERIAFDSAIDPEVFE